MCGKREGSGCQKGNQPLGSSSNEKGSRESAVREKEVPDEDAGDPEKGLQGHDRMDAGCSAIASSQEQAVRMVQSREILVDDPVKSKRTKEKHSTRVGGDQILKEEVVGCGDVT